MEKMVEKFEAPFELDDAELEAVAGGAFNGNVTNLNLANFVLAGGSSGNATGGTGNGITAVVGAIVV